MSLGIFVFSHAGVTLALRLRPLSTPWGSAVLFAPKSLLERHHLPEEIQVYDDLSLTVGEFWRPDCALLFVGAMGIAVRAVAPWIRHKSEDAPVAVLDASGLFCVSLLSGHWGGGNELARMVAAAVGATPVITTASEGMGKLALDMLIRDAGGKVLDWEELPRAQGYILEGKALSLYDPEGFLPPHPLLERREELTTEAPALAVHWRHMEKQPGLVRIAIPALHVGVGFRRGTDFPMLRAGFMDAVNGLEIQAITALATVEEKAADEGLQRLARSLNVPIHAYAAGALSAVTTPNPSTFAGQRFGTGPFSVCEAAAMLSASSHGQARLLRPKLKSHGLMTFAVAHA